MNKFFLWKMYNLRMNDRVSIHEHLNEFNSIVNELLGTCVMVDEEEHATFLSSVEYQIREITRLWVWVMLLNLI